ncbi:hypothetical protein MKX01_029934 [Papaver californicum]|nr:hypothetical protein MKX01_029934 [Papaver californicum]
MAAATPLRRLLSCVILDLDGTLLSTDGIVGDILKVLLVKYGKQWDTPIESATAILDDYKLPCTTDEFMSEITPMFYERWCNIKALPGANRLIKHLKGHGVPMALASNSPRESIETKLSYHQGWKESFSAIIGGDEVRMGKPSPEMPGVEGAKAAGMEVVAVPSLSKQSHLYASADEVVNSLLDLRPEIWGLPPFQDWINGTLPIEPWYIGGPVIKGYGRGSKVLGIPTDGHSIGWNPYFNNTEKTIEPWLLHEFNEDFYGEELRLAIVGYIRPEANFSSLESLISKIQEDGKISEEALDLPSYATYKDDPYVKNPLQLNELRP